MLQLVGRVLEERKVPEGTPVLLKLGADSGQGSFKATLSILTPDDVDPGTIHYVLELLFLQNSVGKAAKNFHVHPRTSFTTSRTFFSLCSFISKLKLDC